MTHSLYKITTTLKPKKRIETFNLFYCIYQEIYALIKRLCLQTVRRPSTLISSILQPLLWLVLFGALFQNAPVNISTANLKYNSFLSPGIIIFTSFTGAINAGVPIMFDREFGFLNRLLISPLKSRDSLLVSTILFIIVITILQTIFIICFDVFIHSYTNYNIKDIINILIVTLLITLNTASISVCLAFILPGHIELLAFILVVNLPMLFSSTALAPLSFMPYWLQILASINPLTYAIEIIRNLPKITNSDANIPIIQTIWTNLTLYDSIYLLMFINLATIIIVKNVISYKFE
uniref:ABC transporter n=1 Tax=Catenella fusiformis TaxID=3024791 RepID=UPI0027DA2692|nr:ABC transporter [Catenella fusiformis]WCH57590.1 ABC transporter [Catenella fusiformis]